ncbi:hypothetical protein GLOTRDRAFT_135325 [Gloeophyllum trabeum ATCC 11539]|uniref:ditrans,polycis-polyprenyl diphosphate synthase [(2E,6E)-farnesyldiphosphate specific] n=1 Tax=Gloeophyllum trabeum (strain ATCC 11539 / FP-39264 / Madison 617) TaxID=670483 RepID=S7QMR1_GLOTA|nr:uncharacterized protein GLOTRDRAFT_135325 [Gloeophyllum trabeum ATCC 11539]EPQ60682.1 hypothetical protein GLOTRDRAFT_135325 [Gloeophyllum trabeum ATCC 11539]
MSSLALWLIHQLYAFVTFISALRISFSQVTPQPLSVPRRLLPNHLALLLVVEHDAVDEDTVACCLQSVRDAASWAKIAGVRRLTVYERQSILTKELRELQQTLDLDDASACVSEYESSDSEYEYPLTPPLSDEGDSMSLSVKSSDLTKQHFGIITLRFPKVHEKKSSVKRRRTKHSEETTSTSPFTLDLLSSASSKASIAATARAIMRRLKDAGSQDFEIPEDKAKLSIEDINSILEGPQGFPAPDLIMVHYVSQPTQDPAPLELYGFPPWQIRLTEISHNRHQRRNWNPFKSRTRTTPSALTELDFRRALDEYALAEMRFGK